jgi:hypothetical protein
MIIQEVFMPSLKFFQHTVLSFFITLFLCVLAIWQFFHSSADRGAVLRIINDPSGSQRQNVPEKWGRGPT